MMLIRLIRPILKVFLLVLDKLYQAKRKGLTPSYPYDRRTNTISLPSEVEKEIKQLILAGEKPKALKEIANLTGASLRISKDYVDDLARAQSVPRRSYRGRKRR